MSKIKNGGLDQYGAEPFERQQFGTAGVERVNCTLLVHSVIFVNENENENGEKRENNEFVNEN